MHSPVALVYHFVSGRTFPTLTVLYITIYSIRRWKPSIKPGLLLKTSLISIVIFQFIHICSSDNVVSFSFWYLIYVKNKWITGSSGELNFGVLLRLAQHCHIYKSITFFKNLLELNYQRLIRKNGYEEHGTFASFIVTKL